MENLNEINYNNYNMQLKRYTRNLVIASNLLRNRQDFFMSLAAGKTSMEIDYNAIMNMAEFTGNFDSGDALKKVYRVPITTTDTNGRVQKVDVLFDIYGNTVATMLYAPEYPGMPNTSSFDMYDSYVDRCQEIESSLKGKYSPEVIDEIMQLSKVNTFDEMIQVLGKTDKLFPLDKEVVARMANSMDNFPDMQGHTAEQLNTEQKENIEKAEEEEVQAAIQQTVIATEEEKEEKKDDQEEAAQEELARGEAPTTDIVENNPEAQEEQKQEQKEKINGIPGATTIDIEKISQVVEASEVSPDQIQDVIFIPHPQEFVELLPGAHLFNFHQELALIKLKGDRADSRFVFVQEKSDGYHKIDTLGEFDEALVDLFPDKSSIGAETRTITDFDDNETDNAEVALACDGRAVVINLSNNVPLAERMNRQKKEHLIEMVERIKEKSDIEIANANLQSDPVVRETELARIHERQNEALLALYIPGNDDYKIAILNDFERDEHLENAKAAQDEQEELKAQQQAKEQKALEEQEAAEEFPEP